MQAKKDNVIRFPGRKNETVATVQSEVPVVSTKPSAKKQMMGGLVAIIAISLLANRYAANNNESADLASQSGGRHIASVSDHAVQPEERDINWEKSLAQELIGRNKRDLASLTLGQRPSDEERLRFGTLKSQYAVIMENGKLSEIRSSSAEPSVYVADGAHFLSQNQNLMPVKFVTAMSEGRETSRDGIHQIYALLDENKNRVGVASFGMDRFGRLLKFSVTSSTSVE